MELTLKRLLEQAKFTTTRKGYDQQEVDDFLDRAVAMATKVEARLTQALTDAGKGPGAGADQPPTAPARSEEEIRAEIAAEVERKVEARLAEARAKEPQRQAVDPEVAAEEAARTLVLAQRTADAAVAEARQEADALLSKARSEATEISSKATADAEQERAEARSRLLEEIRVLEGARDSLRTDVSALEGHVEEQRLQLRSTVAELQRLLDDPATFRLAPAPETRDVVIPGSDDPAPSTDGAGGPAPDGHDTTDDGSSAVNEPPADGERATGAATGAGAETIDLVGGTDADPVPTDRVSDHGDELSIDVSEPGPEGRPTPSAPMSSPGESRPGGPDGAADPEERLDVGPPTAPVAAVDIDFDVQAGPTSQRPGGGTAATAGADNDDAFLAELRKAMADEEPLGPRDPDAMTSQPGFLDEERRGWRFGKRR